MGDLRRQYEAVRYHDVISPLTDPGRLGALGRLYGLQTAHPDRCRVLELGCGQGLNLMAMAARFPDACFVGVDFVEARLAEGRTLAAAAGLRNVELIQADLLQFGWAGEPFDYVVAWGVFSWVPDEVKARLLAITRNVLAPQGLACICYLTQPGCKVNEALRDLMRLRTDDADGTEGAGDGVARVQTARDLLQTLVTAGDALGRSEAAPPLALWHHEAKRLLNKDPTLLFHDELGAVYDPCYLLQFVDWAREYGLHYLTDADTPGDPADQLPPAAARQLRAWAPNILEREQIGDYLSHRTLRVSVLMRDADATQLAGTPTALQDLSLSTVLRPTAGPGGAQFSDPTGGHVLVNDPFTAAVLRALCARPGHRVPLRALAGIARSAPEGDGSPAGEADWPALSRALFPLLASQHVSLSMAHWSGGVAEPMHPRLSPLNRVLLQDRGLLVSESHRGVRPPPPHAALLALLDGRHSLADLTTSAPARALGPHATLQLMDQARMEGWLQSE